MCQVLIDYLKISAYPEPFKACHPLGKRIYQAHIIIKFVYFKMNKPGTAQVGAISEAQKDENHFFYNWRQQKLSKN